MTPTLELNEGNVSTIAMFEYECFISKILWVFEKKKKNPISFLQIKMTFYAGSQVYVENYHLGKKGGANHPPKEPQTRLARGGDR